MKDYLLSDKEYLELDDKLHELLGQYIDGEVGGEDYQDVKFEVINFVEKRRAEQ